MSTTETTVTQDDTSNLNLDGLGSGINISAGSIAAIVILLVLALIGLIIACAYAFGGFKRCCSCGGRGGRKKRLSQLPVYNDRSYLDERDRLPAWNPNASTTEMHGLSRMASARHGLFAKRGTWERPLMLESPVASPRNSQLEPPKSPYMTEDSRTSSQKSRFSVWREQQR